MIDQVKRILIREGCLQDKSRILVAVSTGVDSMVLLHLLEQLPFTIGVVHVNHQLRVESEEEERFLEMYCSQNDIPFYSTRWEKPSVIGMEEKARTFRYNFFEEVMEKWNFQYLLTAHHMDDQMETILMKLVREGNFFSSPGMKTSQPFGQGKRLVRPLLTVEKKQLVMYALQQQVPFFEDSSNLRKDVLRNRIRLDVIPLLKEENKQVAAHFQQWSKQMLFAQELIEKEVHNWVSTHVQTSPSEIKWQFEEFCHLSQAQRYFYLQGIMQSVNLHLSQRQLDDVIGQLANASGQWRIDLSGTWAVQRSYSLLILFDKSKELETNQIDGSTIYNLLPETSFFLSENEWIGLYRAESSFVPNEVKNWEAFSFEISQEAARFLAVRKRRPGDKLKLRPGVTKKVRRFFIDSKVPNKERDRAWVLVDNQDELVGILPYAFSYLSIPEETDKIHYVLLYRRAITETSQ